MSRIERAKTPIRSAVREGRSQLHSGSLLLGLLCGAGAVLAIQVYSRSLSASTSAINKIKAERAKMLAARIQPRPVTATIATPPKEILWI